MASDHLRAASSHSTHQGATIKVEAIERPQCTRRAGQISKDDKRLSSHRISPSRYHVDDLAIHAKEAVQLSA